MAKTLLQALSCKEQQKVYNLNVEMCEVIAKLADVHITFNRATNPGQRLLKYLDRSGCTLEQYNTYLNLAIPFACYCPESKVAILIANEDYEYMSKLVTPSSDCDLLSTKLRQLGFITIFVKNIKSNILKDILIRTFEMIPENSYCFLFYAGHGCELINTKCILNIDCPTENIDINHCVTENWLLSESSKCKPELCLLIMDMCRASLDRHTNPQIYAAIPNIETYTIYSNLLVSYATQLSNAAYECVLIEKEETIGASTYSLRTGDIVCGGTSQYVNALVARLTENVDISSMLDNVHEDVEKSLKKQRPIKVQCGVSKRFLNDPVKGNTTNLLKTLREALQQYNEHCSVS